MEKLSQLFVRRLRHLARRETRRHALTNGLLDLKIADVRGHIVRRYRPAFDDSPLTHDVTADLAWLTRTFASMLLEPPKPNGDAGGTVTHALQQWSGSGFAKRLTVHQTDLSTADLGRHAVERRAYAVRLVGLAAPEVNVRHIATSMLVARAIRFSGMPLATVVEIVRRPAPIITILSPVDGAQQGLLKLIEMTGFIPAGPYAGATGDNFYDHDTVVPVDIEMRRQFIHFVGKGIHRESRTTKFRLATALGCDFPIVAIANELADIPDQIRAAADLNLATGNVDLGLVVDLMEAVYGNINPDDPRLKAFDPELLSLDDLVLALRPGRPLDQALIVLRNLAARNLEDGGEEDTGGSQRNPAVAKPASGQRVDDNAKKDEKSSPWKKEKPSGAEVIQPELLDVSEGSPKRPPTVETLSGYGAAQRWALDLKLDLGNYCHGELDWSQMSTKLLLSGPPGTGKTSFARALCNTLQVPLIVTSVSTWLQGGHLNDVLDKMARTFAEARAQAPSILFIDEIDGIGRRVDPSRDYADYWNTIVNKMLELLDGAVKSEGVVVIGATNRPEYIDEAIKRSGRLETHIEIPKPDIPALAGIIAHHLGKDIDVVLQSAAPSERQRIDTAIGDAFAAQTFEGDVAVVQGGQL